MTEVLSGYYSAVRVTRLGGRLFLLRFIRIGQLSDLLALTPLGEFVSRHAELGNRGVALKEPCLDGGVALTEAVALGDADHLIQLSEDRLGINLMSTDVLTHELIGQSTVTLLLGVRLELPRHKAKLGEVLTDAHKLTVLVSARGERLLRKGGADGNGAVGVINDDVFHFRKSPFILIKRLP